MGKKQKNNSAYNGAPTDKKETVYKMTRTMNTFMRMDSTRVHMEEMATAMERTDWFPVFIRL